MNKKEYTPEYKARVVVELLGGELTASELASRENLNVKQVYNWRKEFLEHSYRAFSVTKDEREAKSALKEAQERENMLMAKVGELTIEVDWFKKKELEISKRR